MQTQPSKADGSGAMFDGIAPRYDLLNRLMSFGLDKRWRRQLVKALGVWGLPRNAQLLDVATGTGDVALALLGARPDLRVTGLDPSPGMLALAAHKRAHRGLQQALTLVQGDAQAMPFADGTFEGACISFGIRNVPDRLKGLSEMRRVVKRGGTVAILELGEPKDGAFGALARWHVHTLVPFLGRLLSGAGAYAYLQRSIAQFPNPEAFAALMRDAGFDEVRITRLSFGAVHLYTGLVR
jgi:demethylmenaquinone methyltransferase/2-methoxy-6-polyprenyl-1,4-benzoquinol methylase